MRLKEFCLGVRGFLFIGLAGGFAAPGRAEAPAGYGAPPGGGYQAPQGQGQPGGGSPSAGKAVQVFNDGVFNIDQPSAPPAQQVSPSGRYMADAPDYNSEQQAQWKAACAGQANYAGCFQREKERNRERVRQSFENVERNQAGRFRSAAPASPLDAPNRGGARMPSDALDADGFVGKEPDRDRESNE